MTLICCLFKAQSCLLNNFQMFTLGCLKVLLISSHNSSPWSGSLVISKRNTDALISCSHVKYCFSRALYLPAVATSWQSLAWCLISTPWCSPWDVVGARCQGLVTFWDGAANSYVFSLTLGSFCPSVFGMAAGTMSETEHREQGGRWGWQAGLSEAEMEFSRMSASCRSGILVQQKPLSHLSSPQHHAVQYKPTVGYIPDMSLSLALQWFPIALREEPTSAVWELLSWALGAYR